MPKIFIKKAKVSDAQNIRLLEQKVWNEEVVNKYDIPMFVRFGYVYVATYQNKLVGAIISYRTNTDEVYVCDLVVDKKYRGQKIAERLYRALLKATKGKNIVSFLDPELIPTMKLHEKLGARVVKKVTDAYDLDSEKSNLEKGKRLFVRILNK